MSVPITPAPIELCPVCFRVMVNLDEFSAQDNVAGVTGDVSSPYSSPWGVMSFLAMLLSLFGLAGAGVQQSRFSRILREFPYSLYCPGCGHIVKRRFSPDDPRS